MSQKSLSRWVVAGSILVAGACAPVSEAAPIAGEAGFTPTDAERVLAYGFDTISDKYLKDVTVPELAVDALRGLTSIDSDLAVEGDAQGVTLSSKGHMVARYGAPAAADIDGWAKLAVAVSMDASRSSEKLRGLANERFYEAAFDSMLTSLDQFSRYSGVDEAQAHRAARNGFGGVGIRYKVEADRVEVLDVIDDSPAGHAGMLAGDRIERVDGTAVAGLSHEDISKLIRGAVGSDIRIAVSRNAQPQLELAMRRSLVVPPTVTMTVENGIANIKVTSFNQRTGSSLTAKVQEAKEQLGPNLAGVLLDLRGNPGGLLDQGVAVADLFMSQGRIVSTRGRHSASSQTYDAHAGDIGEDLPLVVLVDGRSASASEIVAAALQDSGRAVVVGTNSYGKGTVQTVVRMPNEGEMTLTWSRFHSPTGYALHGLGVLPNICTADEKAEEAPLLAAVRDGKLEIGEKIASWRTSSIDDADGRKALRASCPSGKHADNKLDEKVAADVLLDRNLYTRAISFTAPNFTPATKSAEAPAATPALAGR